MSLMTPFASSQRHGVRLMRQRPIGREGRGNERFFQPGNADFPQGWQSSSSLLNGIIPDRARINQQTGIRPQPLPGRVYLITVSGVMTEAPSPKVVRT